MSKSDDVLRKRLLDFLDGKGAHMSFNDAIASFPVKHINTKPPRVTYTFWHLIEHIRITQWDILDFIENPSYKYIDWPDNYWPKKDEKATKKEWDKTVMSYNKDLRKLKKIVKDPKTNLYKKIPWGEGQDILREILVVADHTAYHIGELGILRQIVGTWPKGRK